MLKSKNHSEVEFENLNSSSEQQLMKVLGQSLDSKKNKNSQVIQPYYQSSQDQNIKTQQSISNQQQEQSSSTYDQILQQVLIQTDEFEQSQVKIFDPQFQQSYQTASMDSRKNSKDNIKFTQLNTENYKDYLLRNLQESETYKDKARKILDDLTKNIINERTQKQEDKGQEQRQQVQNLHFLGDAVAVEIDSSFGLPQSTQSKQVFDYKQPVCKVKLPLTQRHKTKSNSQSPTSSLGRKLCSSYIVGSKVNSNKQSTVLSMPQSPPKQAYYSSNCVANFDVKNYQESLKEKEKLRQELQIREELKGFTGKPNINKKSQSIKRRINDLIEWKHQQEQKREAEQQKRQVIEYEQMKKWQSHRFMNKVSAKLIEQSGKSLNARVEQRLIQDANNRQRKKLINSANHSKETTTRSRSVKTIVKNKPTKILDQYLTPKSINSSSSQCLTGTSQFILSAKHSSLALNQKTYTSRLSQQRNSQISSQDTASVTTSVRQNMTANIKSPRLNNYLSKFITTTTSPVSNQKPPESHNSERNLVISDFSSNNEVGNKETYTPISFNQTAVLETNIFKHSQKPSNDQNQKRNSSNHMQNNSSFNSTSTVPVVSALPGQLSNQLIRQNSGILQSTGTFDNNINRFTQETVITFYKKPQTQLFTIDPKSPQQNLLAQQQTYKNERSSSNGNFSRNKDQEAAIINKILDSSFMPSGNVYMLRSLNRSRQQNEDLADNQSQDNPSIGTSDFKTNPKDTNNSFQQSPINNAILQTDTNKDLTQYSFSGLSKLNGDSSMNKNYESNGRPSTYINPGQESSSSVSQTKVYIRTLTEILEEQNRHQIISQKIAKQKKTAFQKSQSPKHQLSPKNFLNRVNEWVDTKQTKLEKAKEISAKKQERACPFKPQINNFDDIQQVLQARKYQSRSKSLKKLQDQHQELQSSTKSPTQSSQTLFKVSSQSKVVSHSSSQVLSPKKSQTQKMKSKSKKKTSQKKKKTTYKPSRKIRDFGVQVNNNSSMINKDKVNNNQQESNEQQEINEYINITCTSIFESKMSETNEGPNELQNFDIKREVKIQNYKKLL